MKTIEFSKYEIINAGGTGCAAATGFLGGLSIGLALSGIATGGVTIAVAAFIVGAYCL